MRDKNCSCVRISKKIHFLGTNPPTQIQEVCQRHLSKTNSHLHQMQATKTISPSQEIQQPQTNANKTFSSQRLECLATSLLHHGPENRIQKTIRNMAAIKGPRLYKKQIGTHREKKHVLTLTLMLVRRKSACKTSAGSSKIFRWLAPLLGPNLDPRTGPKQRPKRRNENVIQFWTPFWGPYLDPKMGSAIGEFRCCPQMFCKQICDPAA